MDYENSIMWVEKILTKSKQISDNSQYKTPYEDMGTVYKDFLPIRIRLNFMFVCHYGTCNGSFKEVFKNDNSSTHIEFQKPVIEDFLEYLRRGYDDQKEERRYVEKRYKLLKWNVILTIFLVLAVFVQAFAAILQARHKDRDIQYVPKFLNSYQFH